MAEKSAKVINYDLPRSRGSNPPEGRPRQEPAPKVFMKLESALHLERDSIIEAERGLRLKLDYGDSGTATYFSPAGKQIQGTIASGSDWVTVRRDGVVEFDSRITLRFDMDPSNADECYLIGGTFRGVLDLAPNDKATDDEIFSSFVRGTQELKRFNVTFSARFEGSSVPARGRDASWIPRRLRNAAKYFETFRPLVRQQFNAFGFVTVEHAPYSPPKWLSLSVAESHTANGL